MNKKNTENNKVALIVDSEKFDGIVFPGEKVKLAEDLYVLTTNRIQEIETSTYCTKADIDKAFLVSNKNDEFYFIGYSKTVKGKILVLDIGENDEYIKQCVLESRQGILNEDTFEGPFFPKDTIVVQNRGPLFQEIFETEDYKIVYFDCPSTHPALVGEFEPDPEDIGEGFIFTDIKANKKYIWNESNGLFVVLSFNDGYTREVKDYYEDSNIDFPTKAGLIFDDLEKLGLGDFFDNKQLFTKENAIKFMSMFRNTGEELC